MGLLSARPGEQGRRKSIFLARGIQTKQVRRLKSIVRRPRIVFSSALRLRFESFGADESIHHLLANVITSFFIIYFFFAVQF